MILKIIYINYENYSGIASLVQHGDREVKAIFQMPGWS